MTLRLVKTTPEEWARAQERACNAVRAIMLQCGPENSSQAELLMLVAVAMGAAAFATHSTIDELSQAATSLAKRLNAAALEQGPSS